MSRGELDRAELLQRLQERRVTQLQVAESLGMSVRQVRRLCRRFKAAGAAELASKKRGQPSNRRLSGTLRLESLKLVRQRYHDFGPTLAHEKLTEQHGVKVSVETLRKWMIEDGIWVTRAAGSERVHQPRRRRSCRRELVQIDGSDHEWFEGRGPRCVLLVYVDDATSAPVSYAQVPWGAGAALDTRSARGAQAPAAAPAAPLQLSLFEQAKTNIGVPRPVVPTEPPYKGRHSWARLLRHVFAADVTLCVQCKSRMRLRELCITPEATARAMAHAGLGPQPPPPASQPLPVHPSQRLLPFG